MKFFKPIYFAYFTLLFGVLFSCYMNESKAAEVWSSSYETSPANGDSISLGAGKIRDTRSVARERLEVGHHVGGNNLADDNGLHRLGSARCYMAETAPDQMDDSHSAISSPNLSDQDNAGGAGEHILANSATNSAAGVEDDVGHGRCWIDTDGVDNRTNDECIGDADPSACCTAADTGTCDLDDNKMYTYLGVAGDAGTPPTGLLAGWQEVISTTPGSSHGDDQILAGSHNLVYNGSFEATDGDGVVSGTTGTPVGFSLVDAATFTYQTSTDPDLRWGDGVYLAATDGNGSDGISLLLTNLAAATTFKVIARVAEEASDDICTVTTTGALSNMTPAVSAGTSWQTLSGTFTTHLTALDDVTVTFISTAVGDICNWDNIAVYQVGDIATNRDEVNYQPGAIAVTKEVSVTTDCDTNYDGSCDSAATGLEVVLTPPAPGYLIMVYGSVHLSGTGSNNQECFMRLAYATDGDTDNELKVAHFENDADGGSNPNEISLSAQHIFINPTPGDTYTIGIDVKINSGCRFDTSGDSYINAVMIPTR